MGENRIWISGPGTGMIGNSPNSVSPLAVVKINTMVKKEISRFKFNKPSKEMLHTKKKGYKSIIRFLPPWWG
jgi:hypothetical protein